MFHGTVSLMQIVSAVLIVAGASLWWRGLRARSTAPVAMERAIVSRS